MSADRPRADGARLGRDGEKNLALAALVERHGTPLYAFDLVELSARVALLRSALPAGTGLCFAMKANPFVLSALEPLVDRIEACSPGELRICRSQGVPAEKVVVSGVHKDDATVLGATSGRGLPAAVTVESRAQLELVRWAARRAGRRVPVLLRLSSGNQFGLCRDELVAVARTCLAEASSEVEPRGVQFFSGTQKSSPRRLERELGGLGRLAGELRDELGWEVPEVEYGPGLPVAYFESDAFDEPALLAALGRAIEGAGLSGRVTLEIGRSLVASCGTYLTRVVDAKGCAGQRYAIADGGIHHIAYYGQSMAMRRPPLCHLRADGREPEGEEAAWNVCGSLCTINDILVKQLPLRGLATGDLLAFGRAGAYCPTEGMSLFLSRDLPAVALVGGEGAVLVRGHLRTDPLNAPARH